MEQFVCLIVLHSDAYACRACAKMRSLNTESFGMNSIYCLSVKKKS